MHLLKTKKHLKSFGDEIYCQLSQIFWTLLRWFFFFLHLFFFLLFVKKFVSVVFYFSALVESNRSKLIVSDEETFFVFWLLHFEFSGKKDFYLIRLPISFWNASTIWNQIAWKWESKRAKRFPPPKKKKQDIKKFPLTRKSLWVASKVRQDKANWDKGRQKKKKNWNYTIFFLGYLF